MAKSAPLAGQALLAGREGPEDIVENGIDFGFEGVGGGDRFAGGMQAEMGQDLFDRDGGNVVVKADAGEEIPVENVTEVFVKGAAGGRQVGGPEGCGLIDAVLVKPVKGGACIGGLAFIKVGTFESIGGKVTKGSAEPGGGFVGERFGSSPQRVFFVIVIAVEIAVDGAGGAGEAFVDGVGLAAVRLGNPEGQMRGIFADDLDRAVGAAAVNDHVLEVGIILREDRVDGLFEKPGLIEAGRDDGDAGACCEGYGGGRRGDESRNSNDE